MSLQMNFPIMGLVTDAGVPCNAAHVYLQDQTTPLAIANYTTGANGKYLIDVKIYANANGDTLKLWVFSADGKYKTDTIVLNITGAAQRKDLAVAMTTIADSIPVTTDALTKTVTMTKADNIPATTDAQTKVINMTKADSIPSTTDSYTKAVTMIKADSIPATIDSLIKIFSTAKSDNIPATTDAQTKVVTMTKADAIPATIDSLIKAFSTAKTESIPATTDSKTFSFSKTISDAIPATTDSLIKILSKYITDIINATTDSMTYTGCVIPVTIDDKPYLFISHENNLSVIPISEEYNKLFISQEQKNKINTSNN